MSLTDGSFAAGPTGNLAVVHPPFVEHIGDGQAVTGYDPAQSDPGYAAGGLPERAGAKQVPKDTGRIWRSDTPYMPEQGAAGASPSQDPFYSRSFGPVALFTDTAPRHPQATRIITSPVSMHAARTGIAGDDYFLMDRFVVVASDGTPELWQLVIIGDDGQRIWRSPSGDYYGEASSLAMWWPQHMIMTEQLQYRTLEAWTGWSAWQTFNASTSPTWTATPLNPVGSLTLDVEFRNLAFNEASPAFFPGYSSRRASCPPCSLYSPGWVGVTYGHLVNLQRSDADWKT